MKIKISYDKWLSSAQKWREIKKKILKQELFWNSTGFNRLAVAKACGYCEQFLDEDWNCVLCPLHIKKVKEVKTPISICSYGSRYSSHFWIFVHEMQKEKPNFEIALKECKIVLEAILEDCPDKDRAIKDGIVFE